jgi:hypothetical protein
MTQNSLSSLDEAGGFFGVLRLPYIGFYRFAKANELSNPARFAWALCTSCFSVLLITALNVFVYFFPAVKAVLPFPFKFVAVAVIAGFVFGSDIKNEYTFFGYRYE